MKKRLNTLFFGLCFLTAIIGEEYCLLNLKGDLFSTVSIGIVVLITGYLFMDSIRSNLKNRMNSTKQYADKILDEETRKWKEQYKELYDLQKATYTATKKSSIQFTQQISDILLRLETLESNSSKELQKITLLQKKSLEGQKNALNMDVNFNKQNTKLLIQTMKEEGNKSYLVGELSKIFKLLEENNQLLKTRNELNDSVKINKNASEPLQIGEEAEAFEFMNNADRLDPVKVTPLYEDPNKNLSTDEIAALFASVGK